MPVARLNLTNPVNRRHPLNIGRKAWWLAPRESGWYGGDTFYDLCRGYDGAFQAGAITPGWRVGTPSGPPSPIFTGTGGGNGWNINCGSRSVTGLSFADNFTVGIQFRPATVAPIDINGLAGLIGKAHDTGEADWNLRQHDDKIEFSGIASGSMLSTSVTSRVVVVVEDGVGYIYHQGTLVTSGAVSITPDNNVVRMGVDFYDAGPRYFIGWIEEAFIIDRPWTAGQVKLDRELSLKQYQVDRGPLNFINSRIDRIDRTTDSGQTVSFTTTCNIGGPLLFATPANFTTELGAFASSGGIGDLDAEGTPEFVTQVGILTPFAAGEPTLVNLRTDVTVGDTLQASDPALFTTTVNVGQSLRTIPNGDRRIISQKRYRR